MRKVILLTGMNATGKSTRMANVVLLLEEAGYQSENVIRTYERDRVIGTSFPELDLFVIGRKTRDGLSWSSLDSLTDKHIGSDGVDKLFRDCGFKTVMAEGAINGFSKRRQPDYNHEFLGFDVIETYVFSYEGDKQEFINRSNGRCLRNNRPLKPVDKLNKMFDRREKKTTGYVQKFNEQALTLDRVLVMNAKECPDEFAMNLFNSITRGIRV